MSSTTIDDRAIAELEQKFDPEMRFRPTWPPASTVLKALLIALSCFHYYTAGFGLLRETTHRGVHLAFVLGLIFIVFGFRQRRTPTRRARAARGRPAACRWIDWLLALAVAAVGAVHPVRLRRPGVSRRQPDAARRRDGLDPAGAAARGHAPQHGLAAADDRDRVHGLCAGRSDLPGPAQACRRRVARSWSTTSTSPARASTASRSAWSRPTSSTSCCSACWPRASGWGNCSSTSRRRSPAAMPAGRPR